MDEIYLFAHRGEKSRIARRRVTAANDRNRLIFIKRTVACRAVGNTLAAQSVFVQQAERPRCRTGCQNDAFRAVNRAVFRLQNFHITV